MPAVDEGRHRLRSASWSPGSALWTARGAGEWTSELPCHGYIFWLSEGPLIARACRRVQELCATLAHALSSTIHTHLFPHSVITFSLHVLSQDGLLLAALINAATLAAIDAGVPMTDYVVACTAGSTSTYAANDEGADPLLDLNNQEEQELPSLTVATLGDTDRVAALVCESRVQASRLEGMLAVGVDGCKQVRAILDRVVRQAGARMIKEGAVQKPVGLEEMDVD